MCNKPILIDNLNYGKFQNSSSLMLCKDTVNKKIYVSCGHCASCLALKQAYFIQRFQMESINNDLWTGMLSYRNECLPTVKIGDYVHKYADTRDVQLLVKRLRNDDVFSGPFKYWFISERGGLRHRPHWHFIISTPKIIGETLAQRVSRERFYFDTVLANWYTNKGSRRKPVKFPNLVYVCRNGHYNYDFHYCNPSLTKDGNTDVAFYVSKYLLKDDNYTQRLRSALKLNLPDESFNYYWSLLKHKSLSSHFIGDFHSPDVYDYLQKCIQFSINVGSSFPLFINPDTSQTFPLSPYYRKFLTLDQSVSFALNAPEHVSDRIVEFNPDDIARQESKFRKVLDRVNLRDLAHDMLTFSDYGQFENAFVGSSQLLEDPSCLSQGSDDFADSWSSDGFDV